MLALDDAALARIVIGATRVAPNARGRWLQRLAAKLDPPAKPKTWQGTMAARQRDGGAIYRLTIMFASSGRSRPGSESESAT
jgi:hypothetical protein